MVEYENITHINVAFAWPLSDGSIVDYPELPYPDLVTQAHLAGKKILPSVGGWGQSNGFSPMAADSIARASFVQNLVYYIQSNEYDGADLDWEFPETVTDRANQILLVRDIRNAFDANGQDWIISMAVSIGDWYGRWSDYSALSQYVSYFNMMAYDVHGPWTTHAGHNAPLYAPQTDYDGSGHQGILYLNGQRGVPLSMINLGLPFYGREFTAMQLYGPSTGGDEFLYNVIPGKLASGWTYHWDDVSDVPYLQNPSNTLLASYDDTSSMRIKCQYAIQSGLAGVMIWALGQDLSGGNQPLLEAVGAAMQLTSVAENPQLPGSTVFLYDNYPNPFNPSTTISYRTEIAGRVTLKIYDVLGREIATLENGEKSPGEYSYRWQGIGVAGGVYVYRLTVIPQEADPAGARTFQISKKLLLLR
jgi:chitinase